MQRKSIAARRGVDVPPQLEAEWRRLTNRRLKGALTAEEAAAALGLLWNGTPNIERDAHDKCHNPLTCHSCHSLRQKVRSIRRELRNLEGRHSRLQLKFESVTEGRT